MNRADRVTQAQRRAVIQRFLDDAIELCGGNPHEVSGMCMLAVLSPLSSMHKGNAESVATNLELLASGIAANIRDGTIELGRSPH